MAWKDNRKQEVGSGEPGRAQRKGGEKRRGELWNNEQWRKRYIEG